MKKIVLTLGCLLTLCASVAGQSSVYGISRIAYGTSSAAKGFAGTASTSETAWAAFTNAASVPLSDKTFDSEFIYQQWAPDLSQSDCFGVAASYKLLGKIGISIAGVMRTGEDITGAMDENGAPMADFTPKDYIIGLGVGYKFLDLLSVGVNVGYQQRKLYVNENLNAISFNAFVMAKAFGGSATLGVSNVGSQLSSGDKYDLPTSITLGIEYGYDFLKHHNVTVDVDFDYFIGDDSGVTLAGGLEYSFRKIVYVRGGYHYGTDDAFLPSFATLGLGVRFLGIKLSGAYLVGSDYLDGTMTIGLGYQF